MSTDEKNEIENNSKEVKTLRRLRHETPRQYEERKELYDKYVSVYGEVKTEMMTSLWSSMKHLGCRYHPETEALVIPWGGLEKTINENLDADEESMNKLVGLYAE